jgi:hypothetical protein
MNEQIISWTTDFDTCQNIMTHTFTDRIKVIADLNTGIVKFFKDGVMYNKIESIMLVKYESILLETALDSRKLETFKAE